MYCIRTCVSWIIETRKPRPQISMSYSVQMKRTNKWLKGNSPTSTKALHRPVYSVVNDTSKFTKQKCNCWMGASGSLNACTFLELYYEKRKCRERKLLIIFYCWVGITLQSNRTVEVHHIQLSLKKKITSIYRKEFAGCNILKNKYLILFSTKCSIFVLKILVGWQDYESSNISRQRQIQVARFPGV